MNEFSAVFTDVWNAVFQSPVVRFMLCLLPIFLLGPVFRMMFLLVDYEPDPCGFFVQLWDWLSDKVITWLCSTEKGFALAYKLGWARPGVDFFDCGQDCAKCPKYADCDNELRILCDDVRQSSDPGAGS